MSYEDFLIRYDGRHAEWVDGEVIVTLPISDRHDAVSTFLTMVLGFFVQSRGLGRVLTAPFQMKLGPTGPGREPDVMFVARERLDRVLRTRLAGPADVAIEIISPDSIERDRHDKYAEYEAAGVPEYWLLDPELRSADFFRHGPDGRYHAIPLDEAGVFHSQAIPGFWLRVTWLWQDEPNALAALSELGALHSAA